MDSKLSPKRLIPSSVVARRLGILTGTLATWRFLSKGPPYVRLGRRKSRVYYEEDVLETWIQQRTFESTSMETASIEKRSHEGGEEA